MGVSNSKKVQRIFRTLEAAMGPQHWWPAGSAFEVVVGAYLTQNTAWTNVERAIEKLREAGALSVAGIRNISLEELEALIRSAGYFRQKAARLKRFVAHLDLRYGGSLEAMFARPTAELREELLGLPGIGPETADSILLYAACAEVFVVDSYTRRIFERHGLAEKGTGYEEIRLGVQEALAKEQPQDVAPTFAQLRASQPGTRQAPPLRLRALGGCGPPAGDALRRSPLQPNLVIHAPSVASQMERSELARRYNEFHALLVQTAKHYCVKARPRCEECPLRALLPPRVRE
jgi:endonuclease-3 related protein